MVNIKSFKDGDRLVLVVENCTGETAVKVNEFITSLLGVSPVHENIPHLEPVKVQEEPMPNVETLSRVDAPFDEPENTVSNNEFKTGIYKGLSPNQAFEKDGVKAGIALLNSGEKEKAKKVILDDLLARNPETADIFEIKEFISLYQNMLEENIKTLLNLAGYESIDSFLSFSDEETLREGYQALIASVLESITE